MQKIFVNYRNGDGEYAATHVHAYLSREVGEDQIFKSSASIRPGDEYAPILLERASACPVMLSVIGPNWINITDEAGVRRLLQEDDWVRLEIAAALRNQRRVVPILLTNARRPQEDELPEDIKALASLQYRHFYHRNGEWDMKRLHRDLIELVPGLGGAKVRAPAGDQYNNYAQGNARVVGMFGRVDGNVHIGQIPSATAN